MSFFNPIWHVVKGTKVEEWKEDESCKEKYEEEFSYNAVQQVETGTQPSPASIQECKGKIIWLNVFFIALFHVLAIYGLVFEFKNCMWKTIIWGFIVGGVGGFGITAGAHRLWCHRSYKAKLPLKILLLLCYTMAGQNDLHQWVRDHRVHHKFSETDADPHNSNRGLFFAHVGWLLQPKHPEVSRLGKTVDMSDIINDPLISWHTKHFLILKIFLCFIFPVVIPHYCWNELWYISILSQDVVRYVLNLNFTWSVNSFAHKFGSKPYDRSLQPSENKIIAFLAMGEGFHNYHHVFPWDYKTSELGSLLNLTTFYLDMFAKIGWAYDLRQPSKELIHRVRMNRGDLLENQSLFKKENEHND